jgi:hypothetical protein
MPLAKFVVGFSLLSFIHLLLCTGAGAQVRPIAIIGVTLIDGAGRAAVEDAVIVFQGGRI